MAIASLTAFIVVGILWLPAAMLSQATDFRMTEERIDERERRGGSFGAATWLSYVVDDATGEVLAVARPARASDAPHLDRLKSGP